MSVDIPVAAKDVDTLITVRGGDGELVFEIAPDGSVVYGEGIKADEAARQFWQLFAHQVSPRMASGYRSVLLAPPMDNRVSMTMLKHYQACPRSGYLYQRWRGRSTADAMVRGSALHLVFERAIKLMIEQGEPKVPDDVTKMLVDESLAELPVPFVEHDYIREAAARWSGEFVCQPENVIACETLIALELGDWTVRCKVDFAEAQAGGMVVNVQDWKSSRAAPGYEELARKRPDGSHAAKAFQLVVYALALAYGKPVVETTRTCEGCRGNGFEYPGLRSGRCSTCEGRGTVREEAVEPFPLASAAERFDLALVFPGMKDKEGRMVRREVSLDRLELAEARESLIAILSRLSESVRSGDWPAVLSDEACSQCPAKSECPIPLELHDHAGVINTPEQAAEASVVYERRESEQKALRKELKAFVLGTEEQELRFGADKVWRNAYSESERIDDREAMFEAVDRATQYGEPFDPAKFLKVVGANRFQAVKLDPEEQA